MSENGLLNKDNFYVIIIYIRRVHLLIKMAFALRTHWGGGEREMLDNYIIVYF